MRRMSFALTKTQLLDGSKTVTRRLGWLFLRAADRVLAVSKGMGLRPGEKADIYGSIGILGVRREPLNAIDQADCAREGFPNMDPPQFVEMFCRHIRCDPHTVITRIEFLRDGSTP